MPSLRERAVAILDRGREPSYVQLGIAVGFALLAIAESVEHVATVIVKLYADSADTRKDDV